MWANEKLHQFFHSKIDNYLSVLGWYCVHAFINMSLSTDDIVIKSKQSWRFEIILTIENQFKYIFDIRL